MFWTATYRRDGETQRHFIANIINYIEEAERNPEFRNLFMQLLTDASATCGDRVALSIITIGIQHDLITFDFSNTKGLAEFLIRGGMAMGLLEEYARQIVPTFNFVDEIEVYLGLPIMLRERLQLPINLQEMLYYRCSSLTGDHLVQAEAFVRSQIDNPEACMQFLINNDTWLKALRQKYEVEFTRIQRNYHLDTQTDLFKIRENYENELKQLTQKVSKHTG